MAWCECEPIYKNGYRYSQFMGTVFGECVYTPLEYVPSMLGVLSILAWMTAGLPQYWRNYRNKHCESLSAAFIVVRAVADISNFISSVLLQQPLTMVVLGGYFLFDDAVMLSQMYYYNRVYPKRYGARTSATRKAAVALFGVALFTTGTLSSFTSTTVPSSAASRTLLQDNKVLCVPEENLAFWVTTTGTVLAWLGNALFFFARIPQVVKNYQEKRCDDLSPAMFMLFVAANTTYGLRIIVDAVIEQAAPVVTDNFWAEFCVKKLPYLLGSIGTLAFDVLIIVQSRMYRQSK
ncbi:PQ loop repeat [Plasmodiophora brassicae]